MAHFMTNPKSNQNLTLNSYALTYWLPKLINWNSKQNTGYKKIFKGLCQDGPFRNLGINKDQEKTWPPLSCCSSCILLEWHLHSSTHQKAGNHFRLLCLSISIVNDLLTSSRFNLLNNSQNQLYLFI